MIRVLIFAALTASSALAQSGPPMDAEAFEAYTSGKTLTFSESGHPYGIERYLPDRRVRWSFLDGECKDGLWYPEDDRICFIYEDNLTPQCWRFYREGAGLRAIFGDEETGTELYEAGEEAEMTCLGPDVGV
ncbi:hypothetical protein FIU97_03350 [Roseivivax sp. THAF40]|uniref:hypothetical protein n=1 Tax=unclassified Roseivivax TaxID=2639302 RepID=UPI0012686BE4|nr:MULTISPECIES: hypothetical protein [unclassified Roseivivax]QFS81804.1 hypothetical protein FIV09_03090 [Roseivivax sp. THAF197b]QFT45604.1 hypothetical protein FIU97_03350 [Roseivivax sp. THAF40]